MAYWLDDGFDTWPEVLRAGSAAVGLYVRCGAWISRNIANGNITDSVIPGELAQSYGTPEWVRKLVDAGLWATEGDGYRDLRYFPLNPTAEKARTLRVRRAEAGRKGGLASGAARASRSKGSSKRQASASANAPALGNAIVEPLPSPSTKGEGRAPASRGASARCKTCANAMDSPYHRNICRMGKTA